MNVPDGAGDWPFEAKAATISEVNDAEAIRKEVDAIAGIDDPNWAGNPGRANQFSKYELTLLLLALGGPQ